MLGSLSPIHWFIVIIVLMVLLMFGGAKRIPELAKGLGKGAKILKSEMQDLKNDDPKDKSALESQKDEVNKENS